MRLIAKKIAVNRRPLCAASAYLKAYGRPEIPADFSGHACIVLRQNESTYGVCRFSICPKDRKRLRPEVASLEKRIVREAKVTGRRVLNLSC